MLPPMLDRLLGLLSAAPERSPDEAALLQELLEVKAHLAELPQRLTAGRVLGRVVAGVYTAIDTRPIGLGPNVTGCSRGEDCPLNKP